MSSCRWRRGQPLPEIGSAVFTRGNVLLAADPRIPPDALGLGSILGEEEFKSSCAVVARTLQTTRDMSASVCKGLLCAGGEELVRNAGYTARFVLSTAKHGVALMMRRHDNHSHIIFPPSAQCLLDQVVAGTVGVSVCP